MFSAERTLYCSIILKELFNNLGDTLIWGLDERINVTKLPQAGG